MNRVTGTIDGVDTGKRDFLFVATGAMATVGAASAIWPFVDSMTPSADVIGSSKIEVSLTPIEPGQRVTLKWRGQPVFIDRRTPERIAAARDVDVSNLRDPEADSDRAKNAEWLVVVGICTHLGCVPLGQRDGDAVGEWGGWFCPCHGSHYDTSGRIRKGPAPKNLIVPPYQITGADVIQIG